MRSQFRTRRIQLHDGVRLGAAGEQWTYRFSPAEDVQVPDGTPCDIRVLDRTYKGEVISTAVRQFVVNVATDLARLGSQGNADDRHSPPLGSARGLPARDCSAAAGGTTTCRGSADGGEPAARAHQQGTGTNRPDCGAASGGGTSATAEPSVPLGATRHRQDNNAGPHLRRPPQLRLNRASRQQYQRHGESALWNLIIQRAESAVVRPRIWPQVDVCEISFAVLGQRLLHGHRLACGGRIVASCWIYPTTSRAAG